MVTIGVAFVHAAVNIYMCNHYVSNYAIAGDGELSKFCVTDLVEFTADSEVELNINIGLCHMT